MFEAKLHLGIVLSRAGAEAALVQRRGRRARIRAHARAQAGGEMLDPADPAVLGAVFRDLARALPRAARRADVPLAVALPDALVREDVVRFADFPDRAEEAGALVRARIQRESWPAGDLPVCAHEVMARDGDGVVVRVRSMRAALRDAVEAAARAAGCHVARLDGWSGFASGALAAEDGPATLLCADGEAWGVMCWADGVPAGFADGGWLGNRGEVVARVTRIARSFGRVQGLAGTRVLAAVPEGFGDVPGAEAVDLSALAGGMRNRAAQVALWA